jgi:hypothetical protein
MIKKKRRKQDLYYDFIEVLKEKQQRGFPDDTLLHQHHIEPKHAGGDPNGELVFCTTRDHARAHYIRYKVYGSSYDLCAYLGLVQKTDEMQKAIQEKIIQTNRERGNAMFNPEWQKIMANRPKSSYHLQQNPAFAANIGQKGGKVGGKVMTPTKQAALQINGKNVGTKYGRQGGLKHQSPITTQKLSTFLEWGHDSGVTTISPPFESVRELKEYLACFVPNSIRHDSGLSAILRGVEPRRDGWSIIQELEFED